MELNMRLSPRSPTLLWPYIQITLHSMITVESDDREIRVTIPRGDLEIAQVEAILRPFRFASLTAESQMTTDAESDLRLSKPEA